MGNQKLAAKILDGSLKSTKNALHGVYRGFYITMEILQGKYLIRINAQSSADPMNEQLNSFLMSQKESCKRLEDAAVNEHLAILVIRAGITLNDTVQEINRVLESVFKYLMGGSYISGCANCGTTAEKLECYEINTDYIYFCENCVGEVRQSLEENQKEVKSRKSRLLPGLVGAFLGALIGGVLWVIIYRLGYIAGLAGAVTGICAMRGYKMLGGHLDKKGVVASVVVMIAMICLANKISWSWEAYSALEEYAFSDIYRNIGGILEESGLTGSYYSDLIVGFGLTALATFRDILNAFRESAGSYAINKK